MTFVLCLVRLAIPKLNQAGNVTGFDLYDYLAIYKINMVIPTLSSPEEGNGVLI